MCLQQRASRIDGADSPAKLGEVFSPSPAKLRTALCVPKTSSTSCDQAIFIDQSTDISLFSDAVLIEVDRLG
jgi:hypothetical protein